MASELEEHLAEAERIVANCKQRVAEQEVRIAELRRLGIRTHHAEGLLQVREDALSLAEAYRATIQQEIAEGSA